MAFRQSRPVTWGEHVTDEQYKGAAMTKESASRIGGNL
jgi:hypothetical protein